MGEKQNWVNVGGKNCYASRIFFYIVVEFFNIVVFYLFIYFAGGVGGSCAQYSEPFFY